tara:strand:+ start:773 stop:1843 length:1071 start_codon:yes stop_codon:yes gene_type:complete
MFAGLVASIGPKACTPHEVVHEEEEAKVVVTHPLKKDTNITRDYVCQVRSSRHIEVRAMERGYLESIEVKEGQHVKEGQPMFKILPLVYRAELKRAEAEAQAANLEYQNTRRLAENNVVSDTELALTKAKYEKAQAEVNLAEAHLGFTEIRAPFPGLVDRLLLRQGSLVEEGELLTTLSDNDEMWAYFNVPEAEYLEYVSQAQPDELKTVSLVMANAQLFEHSGRVNVIEADFNSDTGTIPFRADFPNPKGLLRHGETGNVRMKTKIDGALLIPQKATFEILDHHYVFVVGDDDVVTQQRVLISDELEDVFIVSSGITEKDRIVVEGLRQARNGKKAECDYEEPDEVFSNLKLAAE